MLGGRKGPFCGVEPLGIGPNLFSRPEAIDLYNKGCQALGAGDFSQAAIFFRESLEVEPDSLMASFNLAASLRQSGDLAGAIVAYRHCAEANPGHSESAYNLACLLEETGDVAGAIAVYRACLAIHPEHRGCAFNLAGSLYRVGNLSGAITAYRLHMARHRDDLEALHNLACLVREAGDLPGAIAIFRDCVARDPDHRAGVFNLASALQSIGEDDEAIAFYRACIERHPDHPDAVGNLAVMLRDRGDERGAVALYRDFLGRNPQHRESAFDLACTLQRMGDVAGATTAYRDCMTRHPDHPDAAENLANLLIREGRYEEAVALLEELCARLPERTELTQNLVMARWRLRLTEAAGEDSGLGLRRILVACMPKSGSTFLADVLAKLPGMQRVHLVPDYGRREQELDLEQLINHQGLSYVGQLHLRPSQLTLELLEAFSVRPVFLFRNIWDVMASLRDHMHTHSLDWSMARIDPEFRGWDEGRQYEFLARAMMPWFIDFYVSWTLTPGRLAVRYEDLMADPVATVGGIAAWAGLSTSPAEIEAALAATGHSATFNKGGSGRGKAVPAAVRAHVEALAAFYPQVDFMPLMDA
jgi:Flp pilus assembly protein TadD